MRLINVFFLILAVAILMALTNIYMSNREVFNMLVRLPFVPENQQLRVYHLLLALFFLGFVFNALYAGIMELVRMIRSLKATAASRLGKRISEQIQDARNLMAHGLWKHAQDLLESILQAREQEVEARLLLAEVLTKSAQPARAADQLKGLVQDRPDLLDARYLLAEALQAARDSESAASVLRKLAADHPKYALRALRRLRTHYVDQQKWSEALDIHRRVLAQFPEEVSQAERAQGLGIHYQLGLAKVESDQFREAIPIFQQIIKEDPLFIPAFLSLGRCMILQDQETQGLEIWLEGFRSTGEGMLLQEIEDYFIQSGKPDEGLATLRKVAGTTSHAVLAKFMLGKMLYRLEILDEALELFLEVRSQVVYSPLLHFFIAKIHARRGRAEPALEEYRQLLRSLSILKLRFECQVCGQATVDYLDRCENCGTWNSIHFAFKESSIPEGRPNTAGWMEPQ